jgi:hypothetical protein
MFAAVPRKRLQSSNHWRKRNMSRCKSNIDDFDNWSDGAYRNLILQRKRITLPKLIRGIRHNLRLWYRRRLRWRYGHRRWNLGRLVGNLLRKQLINSILTCDPRLLICINLLQHHPINKIPVHILLANPFRFPSCLPCRPRRANLMSTYRTRP